MSEYKKYDSDDKYTNWGARLTKDAEVRPSQDATKPPMVRLTFVSTSRTEGDEELWIEATVQDRQADLAGYLKKGDTVGIEGKPILRKFRTKEGVEKSSFNLRRAEIHVPIDLFVKLKERGFTPGAGGKPAAAPPAKRPPPFRKPAPVQDVDFGDDE